MTVQAAAGASGWPVGSWPGRRQHSSRAGAAPAHERTLCDAAAASECGKPQVTEAFKPGCPKVRCGNVQMLV